MVTGTWTDVVLHCPECGYVTRGGLADPYTGNFGFAHMCNDRPAVCTFLFKESKVIGGPTMAIAKSFKQYRDNWLVLWAVPNTATALS